MTKMGLQLQQRVRMCSGPGSCLGQPASMCARCCWGCAAAGSKALGHHVSQGWFSWTPHMAQGDPLGAPVCWDGIAAPGEILYPPSVFFCDALCRKKVYPGNTWESYETLFLLLVMLTSLQNQVSLILTVQVLLCDTVLALWRCESAQL